MQRKEHVEDTAGEGAELGDTSADRLAVDRDDYGSRIKQPPEQDLLDRERG